MVMHRTSSSSSEVHVCDKVAHYLRLPGLLFVFEIEHLASVLKKDPTIEGIKVGQLR